MSNSLDHAFQGRDNKRIDITAILKGEKVELIYTDNGSGLTEKGQVEVFNPFYTTMRGYKGKIGLGMYLTFNLLTQLLAGRVEVENPNTGVSMILTFPRKLLIG